MESPVIKRIWEITEPLVAHEGMEIVDIEYRREGRGAVLRFYLDREGGVTLHDLAPFSRRIGDVLDVHEVVPGEYTLEVSSPGVNRRLRKPEHFRKCLGNRVKVRMQRPLDGRRHFTGEVRAVDEGGVVLDVDHTEFRLPFADIAQANYEFDFGAVASPKRNKKAAAR